MISKKVLVVSTYPITNPQHGGQKRARAIFNMYEKMFSEARFVGVYIKDLYKSTDRGKYDIFLAQPDIMEAANKSNFAVDVIAGEAIDKDIHVRSPFAKLLMDFKPDIIHIEQVFPYIGIKQLLTELNIRPIIIFGSQNIEYVMKQRIYKSLGVPAETSARLVARIKEVEEELSRKADLVVAVSAHDAQEHKLMGARRIVIAPNGINKLIATRSSTDTWEEFKKANGVKCSITFVGSGHPPNLEGFIKMVGDDMSFLPDGVKIMVAGGVADYLKEKYKDNLETKKQFFDKVIAIGQLDEDPLVGLIKTSDILLLPITTGGGSNLKTAEAILSGKKIVTTRYSFRGFEKYMSLPNIYFGDTEQEFKKAILEAISSTYVTRTPAEIELANHVQWTYCLENLAGQLKLLVLRSYLKKLKHTPKALVKRVCGRAN